MTTETTRKYLIFTLRTLLIEIPILMALGAFVRAMNAGLSCPDWPLCFGKVIPDFHPGVWYEFLHRADAGLVTITYLIVFFLAMVGRELPRRVRVTAGAALATLALLISAGAMTVLKQVAWLAVTTHLMLATTFFALVLILLLMLDPRAQIASGASRPSKIWSVWARCFAGLVWLQIFLGGVVASTYAGSVCVDWPLCNGQWVPTWQGAIGHQISHRFFAYGLASAIWIFSFAIWAKRRAPWMTAQVQWWARGLALIVLAQVGLGIANLLFFIPPWLTVPHQTLALVLFASTIRTTQILARLQGDASGS